MVFKKIFYTLLILCIFSCQKKDSNYVSPLKKTEVSINIGIEKSINKEITEEHNLYKVSKVSKQNDQYYAIRGSAPLNVQGVKIIARHHTHPEASTEKTIYFNPLADDEYYNRGYGTYWYWSDKSSNWEYITRSAASMELSTGPNTLTVSSISNTNEEAKNEVYNTIDKCKERSDQKILSYYSELLTKIQPIYFEYTATKEVNIIDGDNDVNIDMKPKQARLNIVLNNNTKYYTTYAVLYRKDYPYSNLWIEKMPPQTVSAVVLNEEALLNEEIVIYVVYFKKRWRDFKSVSYEFIEDSDNKDYKSEPGINKTLVFNLIKR